MFFFSAFLQGLSFLCSSLIYCSQCNYLSIVSSFTLADVLNETSSSAPAVFEKQIIHLLSSFLDMYIQDDPRRDLCCCCCCCCCCCYFRCLLNLSCLSDTKQFTRLAAHTNLSGIHLPCSVHFSLLPQEVVFSCS